LRKILIITVGVIMNSEFFGKLFMGVFQTLRSPRSFVPVPNSEAAHPFIAENFEAPSILTSRARKFIDKLIID
jgi:hypothetical protein